jgi:hypothetical protein
LSGVEGPERGVTLVTDDVKRPIPMRFRIVYAVIILLFLVSIAVPIVASRTTVSHLDRQDCSDELEGAAWKALGDALEAPPAPHPDRIEATHRLAVAAQRLGNTVELCD